MCMKLHKIKKKLETAKKTIGHALQPIVSIHSGTCLGYEFLIRGYEEAGFDTISEIFNKAQTAGCLADFELYMFTRALEKYRNLPWAETCMLFYNIDSRLLYNENFFNHDFFGSISGHTLNPQNICLEISEKSDIINHDAARRHFQKLKKHDLKIAADDFGVGFSGMQLLYFAEPHYLKIDRFYIDGIDINTQKRFFVSHMVNMAHIMGIKVIAEGIEKKSEYYICREIGCDYAQGYYIAEPKYLLADQKKKYVLIGRLNKSDKRHPLRRRRIIRSVYIERMPVIHTGSTVYELLKIFKQNSRLPCVPVVNSRREPLGIIREKDLRIYVYTPYGNEVLKNRLSAGSLNDFLVRCPIIDRNTALQKVVRFFNCRQNIEGIIITENNRYAGMLTPKSILGMLNEKKLVAAREQNPLTRLPGNMMIESWLYRILRQPDFSGGIAYFDFNNFKPFNDFYGFRLGDRALLLFADIMKNFAMEKRLFCGHIGGDDFFLGASFSRIEKKDFLEVIRNISEKFKSDIIPFYDQQSREQGFIKTRNRSGEETIFPLLDVSSAVLVLNRIKHDISAEELSAKMATVKHHAKNSADHTVIMEINGHGKTIPAELQLYCPAQIFNGNN